VFETIRDSARSKKKRYCG